MFEAIANAAEFVRAADRDRWLATLYAPEPVRAACLAAHALDLELAKLVATTTEPMIGRIRLAWWRERLMGLDRSEVSAQPVLQALVRDVLTRGVTGARLAVFEDAWLDVLAGLPDAAALARHVAARGAAVFGTLATLLGGDLAAAEALGASWAAGEAARAGWGVVDVSLPPRAPPALRSLAGLAALGRRDVARAVAGQAVEPRATAARQWLLLRAATFGR